METVPHSNPKSNDSTLSIILRGVLWGLFFSGLFAAGFIIRGYLPGPTNGNPAFAQSGEGGFPLLTEVQTLLNQNYLREQPSQHDLELAAAKGMVSALNDNYTFVVDPPVAQSESNVLAGKYGGIGVQVSRDEAGNFVLFPFEKGPALRAGVQQSDILIRVNGKDVPQNTQQDAVDQMLRGEVKNDNGVEITIKRPSTNEIKSFSIVFEEIEIPSVIWRVLAEEKTIGYIQILRFTSRTPDEIKKAITELSGQSVKSLVLDVRNNPGGLLQESIQVAQVFLKGGTIAFEKSRSDEKAFNAPDDSQITSLPLVVLINKNTASAAEIVAIALKDRGRAFTIGQKSYGKGSVQLIFQLSDKSALHVTTAEWLSPNKTVLDGKGIEPDISMIPDENGRDVELGEAIRYLREKMK